MRANRILLLALALAVLLPAAGCTENGTPSPSPHGHQPSDATGSPITPPVLSTPRPPFISPFRDDEILTVYLPFAFPPLADERTLPNLAFMTELAQEAGFALEFKRNVESGPSNLTVQKNNLIRQMRETRNTVFFLNVDLFRHEHENARDLFDVIGDFYDLVRDISPDHAQRWAEYNRAMNGFYGIYAIPTNYRLSYSRLAVLIRNDIFQEYGREIRTATQYEDLLRWLWQRGHSTPGFAAPLYNGNYSDPARTIPMKHLGINMPFALFFPEMGLTEIREIHPSFDLMGMNTVWMDARGRFVDFSSLPHEVATALQRFYGWRQQGLMEYVTRLSEIPANPATVLLHLNISNIFPDITMSNYVINIFSEPAQDSTDRKNFMVAAQETDISEFVRFMVWLDDPENYIRFFYGREDEDWVRNATTGMIEDLHENRTFFTDGRLYFRDAELNISLTAFPSHYPLRFQQEMRDRPMMASPFSIYGVRQAYDQWRPIGAGSTGSTYHINIHNVYYTPLTELLDALCFGDDPNVPALIQEFISGWQDYEFAGQLASILNEADRR
jgi:hypothetical protein